MLRLSMRISPMTAPAASSSAKEGIFCCAAGSCASTDPSEQAKATQQPASNRNGEAARRRKSLGKRSGGARRAIRAVTRPILPGKKRLRQIPGSLSVESLDCGKPGKMPCGKHGKMKELDRRNAPAYHGL